MLRVVRDIAVGYKNGLSVIYAVNMSGGYFTTRTLVKSTDGGATWDHILSIQNPISVATQRNNPDVVIVSANGDLLRSTDGGGTWTVVYAGLIARRIAFSPSNPNIVLAGTYGPLNGHSLWVSADAGATWTSDNTFTDLPAFVRQWAFGQILGVAQRMASPNVSSYLANLANGNSWLARQARAVLPGSYIREHMIANAIAAYDQNIQIYPNSDLERDAIYGKLLYALYYQGDPEQGQQLHDLLQERYPDSYEAELADVQLQHYLSRGMQRASGGGSSLSTLKSQGAAMGQLPAEFALSQNYPNPFNPTTTVNFDLPVDSHTHLKMYDVLGREVATLVDEDRSAGYHRVNFDASTLASGIYFYRLDARPTTSGGRGQAGQFTSVKKLLLLK